MIDVLHPDVVLMDFEMPVMDGVEATEQIRNDHPEVSVIGLSMYDASRTEKAMRRAGAVAYCQKGCSTDELLSTIRECSGMKRL
jgi:DNA-binding NarL/FixJ family response regulator